ncbi:unnamed protein product [Discosporangium mesarthrocarpum]
MGAETVGGRGEGRNSLVSGFFSGVAEWFIPGMDHPAKHRRSGSKDSGLDTEGSSTSRGLPGLLVEGSLEQGQRLAFSAPTTPRGRRGFLRQGGWFYNGDSDYSSSSDFDDDDPEGLGEGDGMYFDDQESDGLDSEHGTLSILERLRRLFK